MSHVPRDEPPPREPDGSSSEPDEGSTGLLGPPSTSVSNGRDELGRLISEGFSTGASNGHGGARPGAGRKPKALIHQAMAATVEGRIADALPAIIDRLIDSAKGGDVAAARYLCDRLLGRVPALPTVPAEDTRLPFREPDPVDAETAAVDAEIAAAEAKQTLELRRLIAGLPALGRDL